MQETQKVDPDFNTAFRKMIANRHEALQRHRQAGNPAISAHSKPLPSSPGPMMHNPARQTPFDQLPTAVAHDNEEDSDDASAASQPVDESKALRTYNDQERAKASQRRDVLDKAIKFRPGQTYLHDFIAVTSGLLKTKQYLAEKEKAQLLVQMLDGMVADKLKGDSRIINPDNTEQIYELLRNTYPVNQQQLSTDLAGMVQNVKQDAVPFIDTIKAKYIMHGVPLPSKYSEYLSMHLKFNSKFNQFMQQYNNQVIFDRMKNKQPTGDYDFSWEDFSRQATQFDQQQILQRTSREVTALSDTPLMRARTRSASVNRLNAVQAEDRYQSKSDGDRSSPRPLRERYASGSSGAFRSSYPPRKFDRNGPSGTGPRPDRPRPEKSRFAADKPDERGRAPYKKGNLISGPAGIQRKLHRLLQLKRMQVALKSMSSVTMITLREIIHFRKMKKTHWMTQMLKMWMCCRPSQSSCPACSLSLHPRRMIPHLWSFPHSQDLLMQSRWPLLRELAATGQ